MKINSKYALIAIILAAVIVVSGVAFAFMPRRAVAIDMTAGGIHKISDTTRTFLSERTERIHADSENGINQKFPTDFLSCNKIKG